MMGINLQNEPNCCSAVSENQWRTTLDCRPSSAISRSAIWKEDHSLRFRKKNVRLVDSGVRRST
jgi:hypothetical protein